jgi:glycosyltransferase involved in cell wall biosynthesis
MSESLVGAMKILLFIRSLSVGGSQRQLAMLAQGLARRGHDVVVATFYVGDKTDIVPEQGIVRIIPLNKKRRWHVVTPLLRFRHLLLEERPEIVYAFLPMQTAVAALVLPRSLPSKLIFGIRSAGMDASQYDLLSAFSYRMEAALAGRADWVIANSHAGQRDAIARGIPSGIITVVQNGIDTITMSPNREAGAAQRKAWGIAEDAFVIGCVARLDPMKDHTNFLRAASLFSSDNGDARFVCVGDGPADYNSALKAAARQRGVAERIVWTGTMTDMPAVYNAFDIATLSSSFGEGFPNVTGEAMACGVPVAATDVGDINQIIGDLGEVVPPRQPEALCRAWKLLQQRLKQEPALGVAIRKRIVANYDVDLMVQRTEQVFRSLLPRAVSS